MKDDVRERERRIGRERLKDDVRERERRIGREIER